jgi:hypothetical protein
MNALTTVDPEAQLIAQWLHGRSPTPRRPTASPCATFAAKLSAAT